MKTRKMKKKLKEILAPLDIEFPITNIWKYAHGINEQLGDYGFDTNLCLIQNSNENKSIVATYCCYQMGAPGREWIIDWRFPLDHANLDDLITKIMHVEQQGQAMYASITFSDKKYEQKMEKYQRIMRSEALKERCKKHQKSFKALGELLKKLNGTEKQRLMRLEALKNQNKDQNKER